MTVDNRLWRLLAVAALSLLSLTASASAQDQRDDRVFVGNVSSLERIDAKFAAVVTDNGRAVASPASVVAQVVVNPAAAANSIGPARNWDRVDPAYRYYYGPNYNYDPGWYATRNVAYPNNYVAYASDPGDVCSTEYYYMPADGVYYCYQPDPVALNSNLQGRCPNQPYLYVCPD